MIAILSDTHREDGHGLSGRAREAVLEADCLVHAGDFTAPGVYEAFRAETDRIEAVYGNRDEHVLRERLPPRRVFEHDDARIVVVHGHEHGGTALSLLGRAEAADLVVFGHSHRPGIVEADGVTLLNPGSHADPRGNPAAHAEVSETKAGTVARLLDADGTELDVTRI